MERQLSVWAAPGMILFFALLAFVFGHPPGAAAPRVEVAHAAPGEEPEAPAQPPPAPPQPVPVALPGAQEKPRPPAAKPAESKPAESKPAEPKAAEGKPAEPAPKPEEQGSAPPPAAEIEKTGDGPTGKVVGRILFEGPLPPPGPPISVPEKQRAECCAAEMDTTDRSLVVAPDGGVADLVVTIKAKGAEADGAGQTFEMDQKCCAFLPRVMVVPAGATVVYRNSDEATHNVHLNGNKNPKINNNLAAGSTIEVPLLKDEEVGVTCDIHTWMRGTVVVAKFRTAGVTGADGRFEIDGVPPGEWAVEVWGERAKPVDKKALKVKVEAGATTTVEWRVAAAK